MPLFKIGSGEITNLPYLRYVARKGRPVILSTGMSTLDEVRVAVRAFETEGPRELVLLHCVSQYPAVAADCNLRAMDTLREAFGYPVESSDHTMSADVSVAAVARGACVIEKHLTLDRDLPGPDHQALLGGPRPTWCAASAWWKARWGRRQEAHRGGTGNAQGGATFHRGGPRPAGRPRPGAGRLVAAAGAGRPAAGGPGATGGPRIAHRPRGRGADSVGACAMRTIGVATFARSDYSSLLPLLRRRSERVPGCGCRRGWAARIWIRVSAKRGATSNATASLSTTALAIRN